MVVLFYYCVVCVFEKRDDVSLDDSRVVMEFGMLEID
jgi:hypothetical protein